MFALAYVKSLDKRNRHKLSLGFLFGCQQRSINYSQLYFDEQYQHGRFNPELPHTETFAKDKLLFLDRNELEFFPF